MDNCSSNKIIYAVRHCSATGQEPESCLTEEGKLQSKQLVEFFETFSIDRILSSKFARAVESITPLSKKKGIPIEFEGRLAERNLGILPSSDWLQYLEQTFENHELTFPNGESTKTAFKRAHSVVNEILNHSSRTTVVVSHGNLLTLFLRCFDAQAGFDTWQKLTNPDVFQIVNINEIWTVTRIWNNAQTKLIQ